MDSVTFADLFNSGSCTVLLTSPSIYSSPVPDLADEAACRLKTRAHTTTCKPPSDSTTSACSHQPHSLPQGTSPRSVAPKTKRQKRASNPTTPRRGETSLCRPAPIRRAEGGRTGARLRAASAPFRLSPRNYSSRGAPRRSHGDRQPGPGGQRRCPRPGEREARRSLEKGSSALPRLFGGTASPPCGHGAGGRGDGCKKADSASAV